MLQIEVKNHLSQVIGSKGVEDWEKRENTLMATVFGFASYLPFEILLGPILEKARPIGNSQLFPSGIKDNDIDGAELWPKLTDLQKECPALVKIGGGRADELDALWCFKNFNLVIEAKKIDVRFGSEQLHKYINAFKNTSKPLWILAVGKGSAAVRSLAGLKVGKDVNLLYINWESILGVVTNQLANRQIKEAHIRRCLQDISKSLGKRDLKPFDSFFCQEKALRLQSNKNIQMAIREGWFPHSLWAILPDTLSGIKMQFKQWLTRPLWVLHETTVLRFLPIPWLTK
ncbi:MAG: hypothetical protein U9Q84_08830 [Thermodesulfobacteriota bacterium]|nr:hypothetical protein [Thermodesulfobacteriota bacterium]